MKKMKFVALLACALSLTACGTENIAPEEAVKKELPALVKTTADTYAESECATLVANVKSAQIDAEYGDYFVSVPLSGKLTFALRNMYTTDASQLQVGAVFENCNIAATLKEKDKEDKQYEIKDFGFAAYLSGGNAYVDISNQVLMDRVIKYVAEYTSFEESTLKFLLGSGKYKIENVITNDKLPLVKKEEVTEENIAKAINDAFNIVTEEDLKKIMALTHDKSANTYDLKFTVTDPEIVNRTYKNTDSKADLTCEAVNLAVEAWTDNKGAFSGASIKGDFILSGKKDDQTAKVKVALDTEFSFDLTKYAITNPSFSDFKNLTGIADLIGGFIGGGNAQ